MSAVVEAVRACAWPQSQLGEAIEALARACRLPVRSVELPATPDLAGLQAPGEDLVGSWIGSLSAHLGLEAEPTEAPYGDVERLVQGSGPALLRLPADDGKEPCFLALRGGRGSRVTLLCPDRSTRRLPVSSVVATLCHAFEAPVAGQIDSLLEQAGVPPSRRARARTAILRERLGAARIAGCWMLRLPPGSSFFRQVLHARLPRHLVAFFVAHVVQYLVMLLSWWVVGNAALQGRLDRQWLLAWVLLLLTQVPLGVVVSWSQGMFAIGLGGLLKLRLLGGALRLEPEEIRNQGAGQLLGRVIESGAVESMALSAGFAGLVAVVELVAAAVVLLVGPAGWLRLLLFVGWIVLTVILGLAYYRRRHAWTGTRLEMTNDLVERMVGHRTRLAQEARERWHEGEDQLLARYQEQSMALDRTLVRFAVLLSRGWMLVGLIGLAPVIISDHGRSPLTVGVALGGILLASRALTSLAKSLSALCAAGVAWRRVSSLFNAASRSEPGGSPEVLLALRAEDQDQPVLEAHDLVFRYRPTGEPVLQGCSLQVRAKDRLLLEGPSGGGKTTLASLLAGLRQPESGLLLLRGLDRQTLGVGGWRHLVVAAPQFHENHVMTGTFAFNLLMGRRWPPTAEDVAEAEAVCQELGLGPLLQRMPAGLLQVVGETGWRLSHGERSRMFMARALLQRADLMVLDESFAALDPQSLRQALECVLRRAPALLVIAHP
jgi:ATP-binding cassette subfamily B protein